MIGIATISGFKEHPDGPTGTAGVRDCLYNTYSDRCRVYEVKPWKVDTKEFAAKIKRHGISKLILIGYSWGAGYGAQRLANDIVKLNKSLPKKERIELPLMLLCDPVYRPLWLTSWGPANMLGFRAMTPWACVKVNDHVKRVLGVRQEMNRPAGHAIKHKGNKFKLSLVHGYNHTRIDESPDWQELVLQEVAREVAKEAGA